MTAALTPPTPPPELKHGDTVRHAKHGDGQVVTVEHISKAAGDSIEVNFAGHCRWVHGDNVELVDRRAAEPPVPDELYNRLRRFLLEEASVLPTMLPVDAQATVVHLALGADEQIENGFKLLVEVIGDLAYERGWASHAMFAGRLADAAAAPPVAGERLAVVEGGRA